MSLLDHLLRFCIKNHRGAIAILFSVGFGMFSEINVLSGYLETMGQIEMKDEYNNVSLWSMLFGVISIALTIVMDCGLAQDVFDMSAQDNAQKTADIQLTSVTTMPADVE